jgi:20S proteasome alpha/beta subunit
MTLVVGLKGADGIVLASDSQATYGELKQSEQKVFRTPYGVIWGSAGPLSATQNLNSALEAADLQVNPGREEAKTALQSALRDTVENLPLDGGIKPPFEALFAWYDATESYHYLLRGHRSGQVEFDRTYGAIGSGAVLGRFGFTRTEFLRFSSLRLRTTELIAYMVAEEAVTASARGVDLPIQLGFVSRGKARILRGAEVERASNEVGIYRERQRRLLADEDLLAA